MDNNSYYYDPEACRFVEKSSRPSRRSQYIWLCGVGVLVAGITLWLMSYSFGTPEELVLEVQNELLSEQLAEAKTKMQQFSEQLDKLARRDRKLYRTLLQTKPIPSDIRQVGIGGSNPYGAYEHMSAGNLLQKTAAMLDRLERRISLQNASYRHLLALAKNRGEWLEQLPAILPTNGPIVSGFGMRYHPIYKTMRMHEGIDIVVRTGTPVYATAAGVVSFAGIEAGYGKQVHLIHPQTGYETMYAHLSSIPDYLDRGDWVERGEKIGLSGNSGVSTGPHLHYEVLNEQGKPLDPISFFSADMSPRQFVQLRSRTNRSRNSLD